MSTFEKILIPLIDSNTTSIDFTTAAGFIDSYTSDPDKPSGEKEIFLVYDDRIRNDYVTNRAIRLDKSHALKRKYVKIVDHVPYYIYVLCIKPGIKASENGIIHLTSDQKISVLQFWNFPNDLVNKLVSDSSIVTTYTHEMPLADYYPGKLEEDGGLTIIKKGVAQ